MQRNGVVESYDRYIYIVLELGDTGAAKSVPNCMTYNKITDYLPACSHSPIYFNRFLSYWGDKELC